MVFSDAHHIASRSSLHKATAVLRPAALALHLSLAGLIALTPPAAALAQQQGGPAAQEIQQLLQRGDKAKARKLLEQSLATDGRNPQLRFLQGLMLSESGDSKQAIEVFTRLTQDFPDMAEPYNNLAVLYADQGLDEKALAALTKAVAINPNYTTAYENMAELHARLAQEAARKAQKTPGSPLATPAAVASTTPSVAPRPAATPAPAAPAVVAAATPARSSTPASLPVMALPVELTSVTQVFGNGNPTAAPAAAIAALSPTDSQVSGVSVSAWDTVAIGAPQQQQPVLEPAATPPVALPAVALAAESSPADAVQTASAVPIPDGTMAFAPPAPPPAPVSATPATALPEPTTVTYNNGALLVRRVQPQAPVATATASAPAPEAATAAATPATTTATTAPDVRLAQAPDSVVAVAQPAASTNKSAKPQPRRSVESEAPRQPVMAAIPATLLSEPDAALVTAVVLADAQMAAATPAAAEAPPVLLAMAAAAPSISDAASVATWPTPPNNPSTTPLLLAALTPQEAPPPAPAAPTPAPAPAPAPESVPIPVPDNQAATPPQAPIAMPQTPPPAAAATPEPSATSTAPAIAAAPLDEAGVRTAIQAWLQAWNSRNADAFLAAYVPGFTPEAQGSAENWQQKVREQLASPRPRQLEINAVAVDLPPQATTAVVRFRESNVAGVLKITKLKRLDLVQQDGQWRIASESSAQ